MELDFGLFIRQLRRGNEAQAKNMVTPANVNDKEGGYSVVWHFCLYGKIDDPDIIYHFVKMGGSLDLLLNADKHSSSLHAAICNGKTKILRALLDLGCPINDDIFQHTPLSFAFIHEQNTCSLILLDAGAKLSNVAMRVPQWAHDFLAFRNQTRSTAITILGLLRCGCRRAPIARDVLRIIARCIWSMRGCTPK